MSKYLSSVGVKADLDLSFRKLPEGKTKGCRGKLVSVRGAPSVSPSIYLKGYKRLMPTFFTLVSDGGEFWLHVPKRNTVYTGPVERTGPEEAAGDDTTVVDLEAMDLARALFVEPVDVSLAIEIFLDEEHYVLSVSEGGTLRRRLRIERRMFSVVGETYYNRDGAEELELLRTDYSSPGGIPYPLKTVIVKPHSGREITLEIRELDLNPDGVKSAAFVFTPPRGARIERLE